jgi:hypothetical protein
MPLEENNATGMKFDSVNKSHIATVRHDQQSWKREEAPVLHYMHLLFTFIQAITHHAQYYTPWYKQSHTMRSTTSLETNSHTLRPALHTFKQSHTAPSTTRLDTNNHTPCLVLHALKQTITHCAQHYTPWYKQSHTMLSTTSLETNNHTPWSAIHTLIQTTTHQASKGRTEIAHSLASQTFLQPCLSVAGLHILEAVSLKKAKPRDARSPANQPEASNKKFPSRAKFWASSPKWPPTPQTPLPDPPHL